MAESLSRVEQPTLAQQMVSQVDDLCEKLIERNAEIARLKEALRFYAEEANWTSLDDSIYEHPEPWGTARAALGSVGVGDK